MILGFVKSSEMEDLRQAYDNAEIEINRLTRLCEEERQKHLNLYLLVLEGQNVDESMAQTIEAQARTILSQSKLINSMGKELALLQKAMELQQTYNREEGGEG